MRAAFEAALVALPLGGLGVCLGGAAGDDARAAAAPATGPALTVVPVVALEPGAVLAVQLVAYDLARLETDLWVDAK